MNKQHLFFDLDDTLIHCNKYFMDTLEQFLDQMSEWFGKSGVLRKEIRAKQLELDLEGVQKHGFLKERFPYSLVETYRHFSQTTHRPVSKEEEQRLLDLGFLVYEQQYEPYPDMKETLTELARLGHRLYLYTGGVPDVQYVKIQQLELEPFFEDRIFIVKHKNLNTLQQILNRFDLQRSKCWMIGNSARTDIAPALQAGMNAIHFKQEEEWEFNVVQLPQQTKGVYKIINSLKDVLKHFSR